MIKNRKQNRLRNVNICPYEWLISLSKLTHTALNSMAILLKHADCIPLASTIRVNKDIIYAKKCSCFLFALIWFVSLCWPFFKLKWCFYPYHSVPLQINWFHHRLFIARQPLFTWVALTYTKIQPNATYRELLWWHSIFLNDVHRILWCTL